MRLVTYSHRQRGGVGRVGLLQGDRIVDAASLWPALGASPTMMDILDGGPDLRDQLHQSLVDFTVRYQDAAQLPAGVAIPAWDAQLAAPLPQARSIRDFYGFEAHVKAAYARRDRPVPPDWYEVPVFYYSNHWEIVGPDQSVTKPSLTEQLDFELELACVIGKAGRDIAVEDAANYIAGFMIMNDWSARDIQLQEMKVGLGPAKGKDFATSLGPAIVTPDELADYLHDDRLHLTMIARINGEEVTRASAADQHWTFAQMIARASADVTLHPGEVFGSGTVGGGCLLELGEDVHPWLRPGDEVELEIEHLGRLRNIIV